MKDGKPVPALKAGGHLDPENKGVHLGPYNKEGHLGDLPGLVANSQGDADYAVRRDTCAESCAHVWNKSSA